MGEFETVNFFKDRAIHDDPYGYYDWLRGQSPVWREPHYGVFMVTGFEEAIAVSVEGLLPWRHLKTVGYIELCFEQKTASLGIVELGIPAVEEASVIAP